MTDILIRAACFVAIIVLGAVLRRSGFFKKEDFHLLSKIVIRITLPAAIVTNFAGRELDYSLLMLILVGFGNILVGIGNSLNNNIGWINLILASLLMYGAGIIKGKIDSLKKERELRE